MDNRQEKRTATEDRDGGRPCGPAGQDDTEEAKRALRTRMRALRDAIPPHLRDEGGRLVCGRLVQIVERLRREQLQADRGKGAPHGGDRNPNGRRSSDGACGPGEARGTNRTLVIGVCCAFGSELDLKYLAGALGMSREGRDAALTTDSRFRVAQPAAVLAAPVTLTGRRLAFVALSPEALSGKEPLPGHLADPRRPLATIPPHCTAIPAARFDLVVVPGLAFDRTGMRLGYGGGYYDAFLAQLRRDALTCGVCFDEQLLDDPLPCSPHDQAVDVVVTPSEAFWVGRL